MVGWGSMMLIIRSWKFSFNLGTYLVMLPWFNFNLLMLSFFFSITLRSSSYESAGWLIILNVWLLRFHLTCLMKWKWRHSSHRWRSCWAGQDRQVWHLMMTLNTSILSAGESLFTQILLSMQVAFWSKIFTTDDIWKTEASHPPQKLFDHASIYARSCRSADWCSMCHLKV